MHILCTTILPDVPTSGDKKMKYVEGRPRVIKNEIC